MESLARICQLFEQRLGFNTNYLPQSVWEKAVRERMKACGYTDEKQYYNFLVIDRIEFQELTEIIVVPETWFFRDPAALQYLVRWLKSFVNKSHVAMARILCIPCSTGEEPYSIAMALNEAEIPSSKFLIEGIDISQPLIERATKGLYGKNAFRTIEDKLFSKYFIKKNDLYQLKPEIKAQVMFKKGNVFDPDLFPSRIAFDAIFCRNLLIYLESHSQKKLFDIISRLLKPEGRLFVAPSELETARLYGFQAMGEPQACALRLESATTEPTWQPMKQQLSQAEISRLLSTSAVSPYKSRRSTDLIKIATEHADKGQFDIAKQLCDEHLQDHREDPAAYYLLGLISHATGDMLKAETYFLKTIYLSPMHHEALVYLSLLMEKKGEFEKSRVFKQRAMRSVASTPTKEPL